MAQPTPQAPAQAVAAYALLTLDQRLLLLPQNEVLTLEPVLDVDMTRKPAKGVGWISFEDQDRPVYALGDDLNPLPAAPPSRRVCVLIDVPGGYLGLICTSVATVRGADVRVRPLPEAMARPGAVLRGLALYAERLGLMCTGEALIEFLQVGRPVVRR